MGTVRKLSLQLLTTQKRPSFYRSHTSDAYPSQITSDKSHSKSTSALSLPQRPSSETCSNDPKVFRTGQEESVYETSALFNIEMDPTPIYDDTGILNSNEETLQASMSNSSQWPCAHVDSSLTDDILTSPVRSEACFHSLETSHADQKENVYETLPLFLEEIYDDAEALRDIRENRQLTQDSSANRPSAYMDDSLTTRNTFPSHNSSGDLKPYDPGQNGSRMYHTPLAQTSPYMLETLPVEEEDIYERLDSDSIYEDIEGLSLCRAVQPAVEELIKTEASYVQSLRFVTSDIQHKLKEIQGLDVKSLFSNLDEIVRVSSLFLSEVKRTESDEHNQLTRIGELFQEFSQDMQETYSLYCLDYQTALSLLDHYKDTHVDQQIQKVLHAGLSTAQSFDLSFYLVMPVQRITKYPLLLQKILESVPPNDKSRVALQRASATMQEVNLNINKYKRFKEVASKYVRVEQRTLRERVSSLNTHTLSKKTQRLSQMFKRQAGIVPWRENKEFDSLAEKFQALTTGVTQLKENAARYVKNLEVVFSIPPQASLLEGPAQQFQCFSEELYKKIYPEFKRRLQLLVLLPLSNLSKCLEGPQNLIRKHTDKLLDYEKLEEKRSQTGKVTWEEEDIMNTYMALYSLLLSELPSCISLSLQWLHRLLLTFLAMQRELARQVLHAAEVQASQMPYSMLPEADFNRWIEECIRNSVSQLSNLTKKFNEEIPAPAVQEHSPAFEHQVHLLLQRHGPDQIYQVMSNVSGSRELDLTLHRGEVVAALQLSDTKGNTNRWLVDTGGSRGYVLCNKLQPYHAVHISKPSHNSLAPNNSVERRRHSYTPQECPYPKLQDTTPIFQQSHSQ
ncbi:rho guanine nucleotide exchange factor 37 isoform X3 [Ascaphus truei]|uniref:rho guanine nucleotide exchange factor 37 isoform X3 n=1 Tax=Ascaphus truei TaxID=8439 RepID=UPI003F59CEA5